MSYTPAIPSEFSEPQIIFQSDRVLLNAKNDSILLFGDKAIILTSRGNTHLDSTGTIILNSTVDKKIQLGKEASEPLLLGNKTMNELNTFLTQLNTFLLQMNTFTNSLNAVVVTTPAGPGSLTPGITPITSNLTSAISTFQSTVNSFKGKLESLKSKQNFTL